MNALDPARAGLASGINNAVSRAAGLLAIALLGLVMSQAFDHALSRRLEALRLPPSLLAEVDAQRGRLGAIVLSPTHPPAARRAAEQAVAQSFVSGFRWVMGISALLALASAAGAWFLIEGKAGRPADATPPVRK